MRRCCWHDWRLGLGVLLTLLAYGDFAPQTRAGCERPTVVQWPTAETSHPVAVDSSPNTMPQSMPHSSDSGHQPCRGPHCTQAPQAPLTPPATEVAPSQEWACLSGIQDGPEPQGTTYRLEDEPHTPISRSIPIYHPPR